MVARLCRPLGRIRIFATERSGDRHRAGGMAGWEAGVLPLVAVARLYFVTAFFGQNRRPRAVHHLFDHDLYAGREQVRRQHTRTGVLGGGCPLPSHRPTSASRSQSWAAGRRPRSAFPRFSPTGWSRQVMTACVTATSAFSIAFASAAGLGTGVGELHGGRSEHPFHRDRATPRCDRSGPPRPLTARPTAISTSRRVSKMPESIQGTVLQRNLVVSNEQALATVVPTVGGFAAPTCKRIKETLIVRRKCKKVRPVDGGRNTTPAVR
jgi:hypothetical protein